MAESTESDLIRQRIEKADKLEALDGIRYPNDFRPSCSVGEAVAQGTPLDGPALEAAPVEVALAGRVVGFNSFGKAVFVRIRDRSGTIQAYLRKNDLDEKSWERLELTDTGDLVAVTGTLMRTRTNELTVKVANYRVLSKDLRPLPEKWHGLKDAEIRQRQRYVDLITNEESRNVFRLRSKVIQYVRRFLDERDFLEVETPMMHSILGGANAKPFRTHHNALDMDLYLRIAPELYLKRLVVGGFDRVYEMNRNFRNEGIDHRHNPEFTMIEFYWAYATYTDLMDLTEELLRGLVRDLLGRTAVQYRGYDIDLGPAFRRLPVCDGLREYCNYPEEAFHDVAVATKLALQHADKGEVEHLIRKTEGQSARDVALSLGMLVFEAKVEPHLVQPTFVTDFPAAVSPLSRRKDSDPSLVDRFELYIAHSEMANAFSELNDPADQEQRFQAQMAAKAHGDAEAMEYDEDYIRALQYGLPPTAGEGIGIDRIVMLLSGSDNIRDVILFPLLRPEGK